MTKAPPTLADIAAFPLKQAATLIAKLDPGAAEALMWDWRFRARATQLAPDGEWTVWAFIAGRGSGKTRAGAEWIRERVKQGFRRIGLVAPTAGDARDVMVEGESGLMSVCWEKDKTHAGAKMGRPHYEPSKRRVTWENGAMATLYSADEPERLRGPQHDTLWCDELAAWRYVRETWDMAMFGLRLGEDPKTLITTTPKPIKLLREILKNVHTTITRGSTFDNAANLAKPFFDTIVAAYKGTRLGRQELYAELLEEAEGALWSRATLEGCHLAAPDDLSRIVIAIDPAITAKTESNETGIVICGRESQTLGHGYLLGDVSGRYTPGDWGKKAVDSFFHWGADLIVAEGNQGGDMVRHTIKTVNPNVPVRIVHAHRGKAARAEPVAALYEQGRIHHSGVFSELEDQLVTWEPLSGMESPDRLDALVWGFTELFLKGGPRSIGAAPQVFL